MTYMQRGNYVAVINPLSYSEVMSDDPALAWGMYDTVTNTFFSLSEQAQADQLLPLVRRSEPVFQQGERFYTLVKSAKRPVAAIVSTSKQRFYQNLFHQLTLTLPLGIICSFIVLFMWSRSRRHITHRVDCCNGPLPGTSFAFIISRSLISKTGHV